MFPVYITTGGTLYSISHLIAFLFTKICLSFNTITSIPESESALVGYTYEELALVYCMSCIQTQNEEYVVK